MTTYCGLECHEKDWGEGHRGRCMQIRKEFVEVGLELDDWYDDGDEPEAPYLTVKVEVCSLDHRIWIDSTDGSVDGYLVRPGQEEAYDQLKKVVEEQGLVEEMDEEWEKAGTFQKRSTACLFVHYMGKSEDGQRMLKINVKQVQPFVKWG